MTDNLGRMTLLWPHTAACLSVTLYLPASSAKYFKRGEGREKFITNQITRGKTTFEGGYVDQALTGIPDQASLFLIPSKIHSLHPMESKDSLYWDHWTFSAP